MLTDVPGRVLAAAAFIAVAVIAAMVALTLTDHEPAALGLPVAIGTLVPILIGQQTLHRKVAENQDKVTQLLNGGTEIAVRKVVRAELTRLVAEGEKYGNVLVQDAGAALGTVAGTPAAAHYDGTTTPPAPITPPPPPPAGTGQITSTNG